MHLVLGDEELLVERAVADVLRAARKQAGTDDVPVNRMRAGEVSTAELAELLSPSLFADERVVVLESAAEAGKEAVALIETAAADLPDGTLLVVVHSGGGRAKALAGQLKDLGAKVHPCARIAKAAERVDFVRGEFRALKIAETAGRGPRPTGPGDQGMRVEPGLSHTLSRVPPDHERDRRAPTKGGDVAWSRRNHQESSCSDSSNHG